MLKFSIKCVLLILVLFLLFSCDGNKNMPSAYTEGIDKIKSNFAPDKRVAIFTVDYKFENQKWLITVETNVPQAGKSVEDLTKQTFNANSYEFKLIYLPQEELGDSTFALVRISTANLRKEPKFSAELVDQAILGSEVKLLKKGGGRYLVQTPYNYLGWMLESSISRMDASGLDKWRIAKKILVNSNYAQIFSDPDQNSLPLSDAVLGATLKYIETKGKWVKVGLPDDRTGFIEKKYTKAFSGIPETTKINRSQLISKAKTLLGIPYLWGGNSSKALDCSGFSQTVFKSQGYLLPRDADMQVNLGEEIPITSDFKNVQPGDLLFFGPENRITHVAISLGGPQFIHSSGNVHINSLKEDDENFNAYRRNTLRRIKRIIKN